ncbi:hypothetical protein [Polynucleobacter sp. AP-Reno-20A-A9]|uniref:hypothetical protein n=1 Tax=Polynucleobacter sp. AP-Reno-20A-A9 TaxID=2576925 RepID=UPI001C0CF6F5|nr:hypothetical protein [Polynucleobacter sp. AP-Reno-20A-A9]MBU3629089.1 hypothetical protein [Polynucleobacter sp. AP-Reno-20A-A9]
MSTYTQLIKLLAFITLVLPSISGYTEETYLQINGVSIHSRPGNNGFNPGLGIERAISENWNIAGGWYYNSDYRGSAYAYGRYSYYRKDGWDLGVGIGAVTGYNGWGLMPMIFPEFCYEWICAIALPQLQSTGSSIIGVHLRVPL